MYILRDDGSSAILDILSTRYYSTSVLVATTSFQCFDVCSADVCLFFPDATPISLPQVSLRSLCLLQSSGQADSERAAHAMADPEIQMILTDPVVRQVLTDFKENPQHAQKVSFLPYDSNVFVV